MLELTLAYTTPARPDGAGCPIFLWRWAAAETRDYRAVARNLALGCGAGHAATQVCMHDRIAIVQEDDMLDDTSH